MIRVSQSRFTQIEDLRTAFPHKLNITFLQKSPLTALCPTAQNPNSPEGPRQSFGIAPSSPIHIGTEVYRVGSLKGRGVPYTGQRGATGKTSERCYRSEKVIYGEDRKIGRKDQQNR